MKTESALFSVRYQLEPSQTKEALFLILDRRGIRARAIIAVLLFLLAAGLVLWGNSVAPGVNLTLAGYSAAVAVLVYCYPKMRAQWSSRRLSRTAGHYQLAFYTNGTVGLPDGSQVSLRGDKGSRGFSTSRVFALRPDRQHTFCIPRSALSPHQQAILTQLLRENLRAFTEV